MADSYNANPTTLLRCRMVGGSAFLPTKQEIRLLIMSKSFGGRNAAAPTTHSA